MKVTIQSSFFKKVLYADSGEKVAVIELPLVGPGKITIQNETFTIKEKVLNRRSFLQAFKYLEKAGVPYPNSELEIPGSRFSPYKSGGFLGGKDEYILIDTITLDGKQFQWMRDGLKGFLWKDVSTGRTIVYLQRKHVLSYGASSLTIEQGEDTETYKLLAAYGVYILSLGGRNLIWILVVIALILGILILNFLGLVPMY